MKLLSLLLLFHSILLSPIEITSNFAEIEYFKGENEFFYQVSDFIPQKDKISYILFKFDLSDNVTLKLKFSFIPNEISFNMEDNKWFKYPLYNITQTNFNITFIILSNINYEHKMIFIDTTKEIKINLITFLNLNLTMNISNSDLYLDSDLPPSPFIFDLNEIQSNTNFSIYFNNINKDIISDYDNEYYLFNYCLIKENQFCNYTGIPNTMQTEIKLLKGEKYKIKLNWYKVNNTYYYNNFKIYDFIQDITLGNQPYLMSKRFISQFFILNLNNHADTDIYIYVYGSKVFGLLSFAYHIEIDYFIRNIEYYSYLFTELDTNKLIEIKKENKYKYLIINIRSKNIDYENEDSYYEGNIYIFNYKYQIKDVDEKIDLNKGIHAFFYKENIFSHNYFLISNNENMEIMNYNYIKNIKYNHIYLLYFDFYYIHINSAKSKTLLKLYYSGFNNWYNQIYLNIFNNEDLNNFINSYIYHYFNYRVKDFIYFRGISHKYNLGFNNTFLFDINEDYYIYYRKIFGNMNAYIYNKELNIKDIVKFNYPIKEYDSENFTVINNELLIISGYKLLSYFISYNTLFEFYIQNVDDDENIKYKKYNSYQGINLIKLFIPNKTYYLDFEIEHLIKLDHKFLNAEVIFINENNTKYILNKENKVIRNLEGNKIVVKSDKMALVYFYQKVEDSSEYDFIEFDKSQKGKIMQLNITFNISYYYYRNSDFEFILVKDFSFEGYFPLINSKSVENVKVPKCVEVTLYIDNYYDLLDKDYELYEDEGEKYLIYFYKNYENDYFSLINKEIYNISKPIYVDNLLTKNNKYNFEVIQPNQNNINNSNNTNNTNGVLLLNTIKKKRIIYQFYLCKNKQINFKLYNNRNKIKNKNSYQYNKIIYNNEKITIDLNDYETLAHSFESLYEFLFIYNFDDLRGNITENLKKNDIFINKLYKNNIQVIFNPQFIDDLVQYHIVISKKNEINNKETFIDPCYITKLMINNDKSIIIKSIYEKTDKTIIQDIDISELNPFDIKDNCELVVNIISYNVHSFYFNFYQPKEFKIFKNENFGGEDAVAFKLGENVEFNFKNNNYFKFKYQKNNINSNNIIYFNFDVNHNFYIVFNKKGEKGEVMQNIKGRAFEIKLAESGIYYISLHSFVENSEKKYIFYSYIPGEIIDIIDLSQKMYIKKTKMKLSNNYESNYYKVTNIKKDTYVYFNFKILYDDINNIDNFYFYYQCPFIICKNIKDECDTNVILSYKFLKNYNYTIYINLIHELYEKITYTEYYYPSYVFFPINENSIQNVIEGFYTFSEPKIYNIELIDKKQMYLFLKNNDNDTLFYYEYFNQTKTDDKLSTFIFHNKATDIELIDESKGKYLLLIALPYNYNSTINIGIINKIINKDISKNYIIEAGKNAMIYIDNKNKDNNDNNVLTTFSSSVKNMKIINELNLAEYYDYLIQNSFPLSIYLDKYDKDNNFTINVFKSQNNFFAMINNDSLKNYINLIISFLKGYNITFDLNSTINFRINTNMNKIYDLFNLYFYNIDMNIIFYIKKIYGAAEIDECIPIKDNIIENINILTNPLPLTYCKNKKSLFNKIINLSDGKKTKLITGVLEHDSYLDIYFEIDNNSTSIKIPNILINNTKYEHTAKYLKRNVEYKIDFIADHLIKLDQNVKVEVYIYNDTNNITILNSSNLTYKLKGNNFKIKANGNSMVYFYAKKPFDIQQFKIDETQIGKNYEFESNTYNFDIGFRDYNTLNIFDITRHENKKYIYIENIYDKIKEKLIDSEDLYLYGNTNADINISYPSINLNNPNNNYTFFYIRKNSKSFNEKNQIKYSLIINNKEKTRIKYRINFCESNIHSTIEMRYHSPDNPNGYTMFFNREENELSDYLQKGNTKLLFYSDFDFIFSYAFEDYKYLYKKGRKQLLDLTINEIKPSNISNIITIDFNPNYINSTTRYIIIIAPITSNNTIEKFKNKCYLTQIVTEKINNNTKIINIYNLEKEINSIRVDVNITEIINPSKEYIVNIISQELGYERNVYFYEDKIFKYEFVEKKGIGTGYIVLIVVSGIIILFMIWLIIHRCLKKRQNIDYSKQIDSMKENKLLPMELINK